MDNEEILLQTLEKIQLNNKIAELECSIEEQDKVNNMLNIKSKEIVMDLLSQKTELEKKVNDLTLENEQLHGIIDKVPSFIIKFFSRKNTKLLM